MSRVPGSDDPLPDDVRRRIRDEIAAGLLALRRPYDGEPVVTRVWTRDEAFAGPHEGIGPDLSLLLADGGTMSILPSTELVARRPEPAGHHREVGMFLAAGPGIRAGATVGELSLVDIAPLLLHRLGLPVPDDVAGRVPVEVIEDAELAARPPRTAPAGVPVAAAAVPQGSLELDPDEQAGVMQRLKALGYVE